MLRSLQPHPVTIISVADGEALQTPRATWCWALAQHRTSFSQPGHSRQRAVGPRCGRRSRSRSYKLGIFTTAPPAKSCRHLRPGMWSPVSLRRDPGPSRGSAAFLPDERLLNGEGRGTTRLVANASFDFSSVDWRDPTKFRFTSPRPLNRERGVSLVRSAWWGAPR